MSTANAGLAKKLGYTQVKVFLDGEPAWSDEGLPLYATNQFVRDGNIVLLDLRADGSPVTGRIARAVVVPYDELENRLDDIPRNAPVVLYSDSEEEAIDAYLDLRDAGFRQVSLVEGNIQGWVKAQEPVVSGPIFTNEIKWVRQLGQGEVSVAEFRKAVAGELENVYVIDARTKEEIAEYGIFKNTVNIPLDEIPGRMADIPKNKRIFVHCASGARADLAYRELQKNGYDVKFLLLDISDPSCDCEIIKP
ncbi:MAG: rhodanese-like domain-containing protein [Desulfopila sp.]